MLNLDGDMDNADWAKRSVDFPGMSDAQIGAQIAAGWETEDVFKASPLYLRNVERFDVLLQTVDPWKTREGPPPLTEEAWARYRDFVETTHIEGPPPSPEEMQAAQDDAESEPDD